MDLELAAHLADDLSAGLQADACALRTGGASGNAVQQIQLELLPLLAAHHRHPAAGVGVLLDVDEQIVQHPLEILHIQPHPAGLLQGDALDLKALLPQLDHLIAQKLLQQDHRVVFLQLQVHVLLSKHQEIAEQLIREYL